MRSDQLGNQSYRFSLRVIKLADYLCEKRKFVVANQILRSGTSIGANIVEARQAESTADFIHKLSIANKEAFETEYWLCLLRDSDYISAVQANSLLSDCNHLKRMLISSIRTAKSRL